MLVWALFLCLMAQVDSQLCAGPCNCSGLVTHCPEGVPLVKDGCQCCQICARQRGEACDRRNICDIEKGLQCDYSASYPGGTGECVSEDESGCEINGVTYRKGERFQLGCSGSCTCHGGGVGCVSLCPPSVRLPTPDCPHPREVKRPGECCKVWVCEDMDNAVDSDTQTAHRPHRGWLGVSDYEQSWIQNQNQVQNGIQNRIQSHNWIQNQQQISATGCIKQSTEWSACSRSCGPGVSVRVSNQNQFCRLERQTRFCQVRPCWTVPPKTHMGGGRCKASYRSRYPERLQQGVCQSLRLYRPRYCSLCSGDQCCTPFRTRTVLVPFACPTGGRMGHYRPTLFPVMVIDSCVCHSHCPLSDSASSRGTVLQA